MPATPNSPDMNVASTHGHGANKPETGSSGGAAKSWNTIPATAIAISDNPRPTTSTESGRANARISPTGSGDVRKRSARRHSNRAVASSRTPKARLGSPKMMLSKGKYFAKGQVNV